MDLRDQKVLVLGSGEVAHRKAEPLREAGAAVIMRDAFVPTDLDGCRLAVGADAALPELEALAAEAKRRGVPINVVDRPELGSVIMPAIVDRDPVTIAIGTGGAAPVLARLLRQRIEALVPPGFGRLARLADRLQGEIRRALPDLGLRRRVLERMFTGPAAELAFSGHDDEAEAAMRAELATGAPPGGVVHLVGAGPGAGDLLTLRAHRLLGEADVIVHDRLVSGDVLGMARRDAERIFVGKARAKHCMRQEEINALLVRLGRAGKRVVRLKGGDPLVFGRGGEEAEALAAAGVAYEIVPGITAALACAASAGIALTHRDAARAVTLVTGHTKDGTLDVDFPALARHDGTIAVYMGTHTLAPLCAGLLAHGMPAETPAALVADGGTERARVLRDAIGVLAETGAGFAPGRPTLVLIGAVVGREGARELRRVETAEPHA